MLQQKVLIVDGGITGLMSAYWATRKGYEVSLVSKSKVRIRMVVHSSTFESSTWDGLGNRYITLTEGHPSKFFTDLTQGRMLTFPLDQGDAL
jgi:monoamine oxidase